MITPGRLWWLLQRDLRRGWAASFHAHFTLPKIAAWRRPRASAELPPVAIHVLTGANDWRLAAWMLASWFHFSGRDWRVVIHDDGSLPDAGAEMLLRLFGEVRLIRRSEADAEMDRALQSFPHCREYRRAHPLALKIFDVPHFASGDRCMVFDSDLLFFDVPREIIDWVDAKDEACWFNEDVKEGALITLAEAQEKFDVKAWPRVNSGLCLIETSTIDFAFIERVLTQTALLRGHLWRVEQTLFMLCAARAGRGGLLPRKYEVSLDQSAAADALSRHYVGAVRDRFYAEGLRRLRGTLLAGTRA
jgi:hypothetical protein